MRPKKERSLTIKVNERELSKIKENAETSSMSVSNYLRSLGMAGIRYGIKGQLAEEEARPVREVVNNLPRRQKVPRRGDAQVR